MNAVFTALPGLVIIFVLAGGLSTLAGVLFRFEMREKFTVADESSRKFSVRKESVVSVAIRCIFMQFLEQFRVTLVADQR